MCSLSRVWIPTDGVQTLSGELFPLCINLEKIMVIFPPMAIKKLTLGQLIGISGIVHINPMLHTDTQKRARYNKTHGHTINSKKYIENRNIVSSNTYLTQHTSTFEVFVFSSINLHALKPRCIKIIDSHYLLMNLRVKKFYYWKTIKLLSIIENQRSLAYLGFRA